MLQLLAIGGEGSGEPDGRAGKESAARERTQSMRGRAICVQRIKNAQRKAERFMSRYGCTAVTPKVTPICASANLALEPGLGFRRKPLLVQQLIWSG